MGLGHTKSIPKRFRQHSNPSIISVYCLHGGSVKSSVVDMTCSHRLRGVPSSTGSPSLLHLRALAPQRRVVSSWQGTVEPQPPPHASSVVAWPIARQGFYGGQPTGYPTDTSPGRSHSPHSNMTGPYNERLSLCGSFLEHNT